MNWVAMRMGFLFTTLLVTSGLATAQTLPVEPLKIVDALANSTTDAESSRLDDAMWNYREHLRLKLEALLSSPSKETQLWAICMIGQYRLERSAPALAAIITLRDKVRDNSAMWLWNTQPVVTALVEIGNPAIPAVISRIESTDDTDVQAECDEVIYDVEKNDADISCLVLSRAIAKATSQDQKSRLIAALEHMSKFKKP